MTFTKVLLVLHDLGSVVIKDYVDSNGKFVGIGTRAAGAISRREAIHYVTPPTEEAPKGVDTFIPFHAITSAVISKSAQEYTKPEDEFCKAMECPSQPLCPSPSEDVMIVEFGTDDFKCAVTNSEKVKAVTKFADEHSKTFDNGTVITEAVIITDGEKPLYESYGQRDGNKWSWRQLDDDSEYIELTASGDLYCNTYN